LSGPAAAATLGHVPSPERSEHTTPAPAAPAAITEAPAAAALAGAVSADRVRALQRSAGNAAVGRYLTRMRASRPGVLARVPTAVAPPAPETPEQALALVDPVLARFQQAVDAADEPLVRATGAEVGQVWERVELARLNTPAAPASGQPTATPDQPAARTSDAAYDRARQAVLRTIPAQRFRGADLARPQPPVPDATLVEFITEHVGSTAWTIKDATTAVGLLARDPISEADGWTVVGLLRQHLNPWEFALMLAAIRAAGAENALPRLPQAPAAALSELRALQPMLLAQPGMQPGGAVAKLALVPDASAVELVQPLSPAEVTAELYGAGASWRDVLLPLNRTTMAGASDGAWLPAGTRLMVLADGMQPLYRLVFAAAASGRARTQQSAERPIVTAQPDGPIVPGTQIRLAVSWPNAAFEAVDFDWSVANDPRSVANGEVPERVQGPHGTMRWGAPSTNVVWEPTAAALGNHVIHCRMTLPGGEPHDAAYTVVVMTPEERLGFAQKADTGPDRSPADLLTELRRRRDEMHPGEQRTEIDTRIRQIEESLRGSDPANMRPLHGSYVATEGHSASIPLTIYVDVDRSQPQGGSMVHLKLWDYTLNGPPRTYTASGAQAGATLNQLIRSFADDAPYPTGRIRVAVPAAALGFADVTASSVDAETDGGMLIDDVLRGLSMVATGVGVVAAFAGQPEVAVPAFVISGVLAGEAAVFSLADRLEHGDFEWDLQTGMDLLDIAAAVATVGMASSATTAARGVGRLTLIGQMNRAVGVTQIAVQVGVHSAAIATAVASGDRQRIASALAQALAAGALFLIVHKAGARMGASVDDSLTAATRTRTATGAVDPEALTRLMSSLPEIPRDETMLRAFAAESVLLPREQIRLVQLGGGRGEGVSGAPVYLIHDQNGRVVGALKFFPKAEEFARELSALQHLGQMNLPDGRAPTPRGVARSGTGGLLVASAAEGEALNRMMARAGAAAGPERESAFRSLRDAIAATARALSQLHATGTRGQVAPEFIDRHVNAMLDIMNNVERAATRLARVHFDPAAARPRAEGLVAGFREQPGGSAVVHGDAHPGNFFYDPATGVTMIDTPTLHYSIDANGNPIGAAGRDVGNFGQKLAHFGSEFGLRPEEITELQRAFQSGYTEAGGGPSTPQADAFFRARTALGELLRTANDTTATDAALAEQARLAREALGMPAEQGP
jgi:hypothetical protein